MSTWQDFIQGIVTRFNQSFGVTGFFASPNEAAAWVQAYVINPNPRLTPIEKDILTANSMDSRSYANNQVATTSMSPRDGALLYWSMMRDYIVLNTYDQKLYDLFDVAVDGARSTTPQGQIEDTPTDPIKLPWWIFALPVAWLFLRRK